MKKKFVLLAIIIGAQSMISIASIGLGIYNGKSFVSGVIVCASFLFSLFCVWKILNIK